THYFFFQAEDGIRDKLVTGVQTCALPISTRSNARTTRSTNAGTPPVWLSTNSSSPGRDTAASRAATCARSNGRSVVVPSSTPAKIGRASCRERARVVAAAGRGHEAERTGG